MLTITNVKKTFNKGTVNEKKALNGINLHLAPGDFVTIIGGNGAGKSTFLKILSGQLEPTNGSITMTPGQRLSVLEQDHFKYDRRRISDRFR